ncbi:MAG TPA: short-chain dehydrogenase/reductase SDR, partial [Dehalococcoidia bacterium]|nr:short-chain dehydrogenase/reductase SDR [Dehalococcoidia bacterium]
MELGTGKTAVVTGGGSGIGAALCKAFAAESLSVVVSDIDLSAAEGISNSINDTGGNAIAVRTDVSDRSSIKELADAAFEAF